jgi:hypothetical protein
LFLHLGLQMSGARPGRGGIPARVALSLPVAPQPTCIGWLGMFEVTQHG